MISTISIICSSIQAQEPFETAALHLNYITNTNRNTFHQYWKPLYGLEACGEMPFYLGSVEGGLQYFSFDGKFSEYPEFYSLYFFVGWGLKIHFGSNICWYNGLRVGTYQMQFDDDQIHPTQAVESELGSGISTRVELAVFKRVNIHIGSDYLVVFTHKRLTFVFVKVGISYLVSTPGWLVDFLK